MILLILLQLVVGMLPYARVSKCETDLWIVLKTLSSSV